MAQKTEKTDVMLNFYLSKRYMMRKLFPPAHSMALTPPV